LSARLALVLAAALLFAAVGLGAFGAHALKAQLAPDMQAIWQTAVQYHAWHALGLLAMGLFTMQRPDAPGASLAAWLFVAGIVLFSGSLYALALSGVRGLGAVTPFGGAAFLAGWLAFAWAAWRTA
jgi:uncharacterized membrane protein YgdD (TMEM256/DUF423 family)